MRFEEWDLLQDLRVHAAVVQGDDLYVSLYGGRHNVCGSVRFTFQDGRERRRQLARLERWMTAGTLVSLLSYRDVLSLFCEEAVLIRALEPA